MSAIINIIRESLDRNKKRRIKFSIRLFLLLGKKISAIMHQALPPPQASMVSKLELKISACFQAVRSAWELILDVPQHS
jgi:hypothetical protein